MWPFGRKERVEPAPPAARGRELIGPAPGPRIPGGWANLPAIQRAVGAMPLIVRNDAFQADLAAQRPPHAFVGSLGHLISPDAPSGIVSGLAEPVAQRVEAGRAAAPVPAADPAPGAAGDRAPQRLIRWPSRIMGLQRMTFEPGKPGPELPPPVQQAGGGERAPEHGSPAVEEHVAVPAGGQGSDQALESSADRVTDRAGDRPFEGTSGHAAGGTFDGTAGRAPDRPADGMPPASLQTLRAVDSLGGPQAPPVSSRPELRVLRPLQRTAALSPPSIERLLTAAPVDSAPLLRFPALPVQRQAQAVAPAAPDLEPSAAPEQTHAGSIGDAEPERAPSGAEPDTASSPENRPPSAQRMPEEGPPAQTSDHTTPPGLASEGLPGPLLGSAPPGALGPSHADQHVVQRAADASSFPDDGASRAQILPPSELPDAPTLRPPGGIGRRLGLGAPLEHSPPATNVQRSVALPSTPRAAPGAPGHIEHPLSSSLSGGGVAGAPAIPPRPDAVQRVAPPLGDLLPPAGPPVSAIPVGESSVPARGPSIPGSPPTTVGRTFQAAPDPSPPTDLAVPGPRIEAEPALLPETAHKADVGSPESSAPLIGVQRIDLQTTAPAGPEPSTPPPPVTGGLPAPAPGEAGETAWSPADATGFLPPAPEWHAVTLPGVAAPVATPARSTLSAQRLATSLGAAPGPAVAPGEGKPQRLASAGHAVPSSVPAMLQRAAGHRIDLPAGPSASRPSAPGPSALSGSTPGLSGHSLFVPGPSAPRLSAPGVFPPGPSASALSAHAGWSSGAAPAGTDGYAPLGPPGVSRFAEPGAASGPPAVSRFQSPPPSPGDVAVAAGIAQRMADGAVVFSPPPLTGYEDVAASAAPPLEPPAAPMVQRQAPPAATPPAAAAPPPGAPGAGASSGDLDDLARRLYPKIRPYLKKELWLDRERAGLLMESGR